jgi:hypothetical protein
MRTDRCGQGCAFDGAAENATAAAMTAARTLVPRDRRLSEREAELEQFTMDVWRTPEVICAAHLAMSLRSSAEILGLLTRETARASMTGTPRDASG